MTVPTYEATGMLNPAEQRPTGPDMASASAPFVAMGKFGDAISGVGMDIAEQQVKLERQKEVTKASTQAALDALAAREEVTKSGVKGVDLPAAWEQVWGGIEENTLKGIADPFVKEQVRSHLANLGVHHATSIRHEGRQKSKDEFTADTITLRDDLQRAIRKNPSMTDYYERMYTDHIGNGFRAGALTEEEATKEVRSFQTDNLYEQGVLEADTSPDRFMYNAAAGKYELLDPKKRVELVNHAHAKKASLEADAERQLHIEQTKVFPGYWSQTYEGNLGLSDIEKLATARTISKEMAGELRGLIVKRSEAGGYFSDPGYLSQLQYDIITTPGSAGVLARINDGLRSRKLNYEDAGKLKILRDQRLEHEKVMAEKKPAYWSDAESLVRSSVYPTLMDSVTPEKNVKLVNSLNEFITRVRSGKEDVMVVAREISRRNLGLDKDGNHIGRPEESVKLFKTMDMLFYAEEQARAAIQNGTENPYKHWTAADWETAAQAIERDAERRKKGSRRK